MAIAFVEDHGDAQEKPGAADTAITIAPASSIPVGAALCLSVAIDNSTTVDGTSTDISVGDTKNTWTRAFERTQTSGAAADGLTVADFYCNVTTQLETTDTITVTTPSVVAKACTLIEYSVAGGSTLAPAAGAVAESSATSLVAAGVDIVLSSLANKEYLFRGIGASETSSVTAPTADADYSLRGDIGTTGGGSATNVRLYTSDRIVTGTGDTWTFDPNINAEYQAFLIAYEEVSGAAPTTKTLAALGVGG